MASTPTDTQVFATGAIRNASQDRINPEGFISPKVMRQYCEYMHKNRYRPNGDVRAADNWQLGITQQAYGESMQRHNLEFHERHRELGNHLSEPSPYRDEQMVEICCALMFNSMGYLFEELKKPPKQKAQEASVESTHYSDAERQRLGGYGFGV